MKKKFSCEKRGYTLIKEKDMYCVYCSETISHHLFNDNNEKVAMCTNCGKELIVDNERGNCMW
jgi:uncharacterized Zn finger protein